MGLLQPIILAPIDVEAYEVIAGGRRLLAVERLGWTSISAGILDQRPDVDLGRAISLTTNMIRENLQAEDCVDAIAFLCGRYGRVMRASEEFGLPLAGVVSRS